MSEPLSPLPSVPGPTLESVARAAGVSVSTVSRGLRNDPQIAPATRRRIQRIAREAGYRANPYVSVLMSHVRQSRPAPYIATLAWLDRLPPNAWRKNPVQTQFFLGAQARAEELGFRLERIACRTGLTPARLREILHHRGINGVLCSADQLDAGSRELPLEVEGIAVATVGCRFTRPDLHFSTNDQFATARLGHRRLRALGYRRVGFVTTRGLEAQVDYRLAGGFLSIPTERPEDGGIPVFFADEHTDGEFAAWLDRHRPEAVLTTYLTELAEKIRRTGRRIPEDLGFALLDRDEENGAVAGVCQEHRRVGAGAVDVVVSQIRRNEFGLPLHAQGVLIEGAWIDGPSAPPRTG